MLECVKKIDSVNISVVRKEKGKNYVQIKNVSAEKENQKLHFCFFIHERLNILFKREKRFAN